MTVSSSRNFQEADCMGIKQLEREHATVLKIRVFQAPTGPVGGTLEDQVT